MEFLNDNLTMTLKLIISPTSNRQRYDVFAEGEVYGVTSKQYFANELPFVHVAQLTPTIITTFAAFGYKLERKEEYPMGGRVFHFAKDEYNNPHGPSRDLSAL